MASHSLAVTGRCRRTEKLSPDDVGFAPNNAVIFTNVIHTDATDTDVAAKATKRVATHYGVKKTSSMLDSLPGRLGCRVTCLTRFQC